MGCSNKALLHSSLLLDKEVISRGWVGAKNFTYTISNREFLSSGVEKWGT